MTVEGLALYFRVFFIIAGLVILLGTTITYFYSWRVMFPSQKLLGVGFFCYQLVALFALYHAAKSDYPASWFLLIPLIGQFSLLTYLFFPMKERRRRLQILNRKIKERRQQTR